MFGPHTQLRIVYLLTWLGRAKTKMRIIYLSSSSPLNRHHHHHHLTVIINITPSTVLILITQTSSSSLSLYHHLTVIIIITQPLLHQLGQKRRMVCLNVLTVKLYQRCSPSDQSRTVKSPQTNSISAVAPLDPATVTASLSPPSHL